MKHSNTLRSVIRSAVVLAACPLQVSTLAETPLTVMPADIDSGTTSPQGLYRRMDVADQVYDVDDTDGYSYQTDYN